MQNSRANREGSSGDHAVALSLRRFALHAFGASELIHEQRIPSKRFQLQSCSRSPAFCSVASIRRHVPLPQRHRLGMDLMLASMIAVQCCILLAMSSAQTSPCVRTPRLQRYPYPLFVGSGFPYKVANPSKGAFVIILVAGYQGISQNRGTPFIPQID